MLLLYTAGVEEQVHQHSFATSNVAVQVQPPGSGKRRWFSCLVAWRWRSSKKLQHNTSRTNQWWSKLLFGRCHWFFCRLKKKSSLLSEIRVLWQVLAHNLKVSCAAFPILQQSWFGRNLFLVHHFELFFRRLPSATHAPHWFSVHQVWLKRKFNWWNGAPRIKNKQCREAVRHCACEAPCQLFHIKAPPGDPPPPHLSVASKPPKGWKAGVQCWNISLIEDILKATSLSMMNPPPPFHMWHLSKHRKRTYTQTNSRQSVSQARNRSQVCDDWAPRTIMWSRDVIPDPQADPLPLSWRVGGGGSPRRRHDFVALLKIIRRRGQVALSIRRRHGLESRGWQ